MAESDLRSGAESLRVLAATLAAGETTRRALVAWWRHAPPKARPELRRLSARIALGEAPGTAIGRSTRLFGVRAPIIGALVSTAVRLGCDPAHLFDGLAADMERSAAEMSHARTLTAGSLLSARMIGALPLLCVPVLPAAIRRSGAMGLAAVMAGSALCAFGAWWLRRLMPSHETGDPIALVADTVALACDAGAELGRAFDLIARNGLPGFGEELERLRRLARLGLGWPGALVWSTDERLVALGRSLLSATRNGVSCSTVLREHAIRLRSVAARRAETAARRAPVAMIFPLALCLLPGFALILIVPFASAVAHH